MQLEAIRKSATRSEPEYYATHYALITPLLRLLRKPVIEYVHLSSSQGQYLRRSDDT